MYLPGAYICKGGITNGDNTWNNSLWFQVSDEVTQLTVACMHGVDDSVLVDLWQIPIQFNTHILNHMAMYIASSKTYT